MEERIYGIDTGGYKPQDIILMPDWELFLEYYSATRVAWQIRHDTYRDNSKGYVPDEERDAILEGLKDMQYAIEYLIYVISKRNNIKVSEPEAGKHIDVDRKTFMKWYNYYSDYFIHVMPDSTWREFSLKRKDNLDVTEYLPKGNWREYEP